MSTHQRLDGFGVAITRPIDQAKKLSTLIHDVGGQTFYFPLIAISGLENYTEFNHAISRLQYVDWIIFISSNAVENAMPRIRLAYPNLPKNCRFAAIGPVTAQELNKFDITNILIPQGRFDSESLLSMPELQDMLGKNVLIVRGIGGREILAETLKSRGANVHFAECYQRINPQTDCHSLAHLYHEKKCHALVVTSSEAMQHLFEMVERKENWRQLENHWLKRIKICVNHARIAEHPSLEGCNVHIAPSAGDESMLNCLIKALNAT